MKQKILYILMIITALLGGNGEAWAQPNVDGYSSPITDMDVITTAMFFRDWTEIQNRSTSYKANDYVTFILVGNDGFGINDVSAGGFKNDKKSLAATLSWSIKDGYYIYITQLSCSAFHTIAWNEPSHSINGAYAKTGGISAGKATTATSSNLSLGNTNNVSITLGNTTSYMRQISAQYKIVHYTLITTAIDDAITYASGKSGNIVDSLDHYLTAAINSATTFKSDCAFPKSYWNGSPVGKSPEDVTEAAAKLKAIADYLVVRTNASVYKNNEIPDEVYRQLHQYDQYDPNNFDSNTINNAKADIERAIGYAQNTRDAYISAKDAIARAAARTDHNAAAALEADVTKATNELEAATTVDAINAALANIKNFDNITFNGPFSVDEGATIDNPANAASGNIVAYSSSDPTVMSVEGTTLTALKPGTVTITASTTTNETHYGYTAIQEYTITAKSLVLEPTEKCSVNLDVEYPTVTLNRTFTTGHHSTLALPFNTYISDLSESPEAYAAQLSLVTYNQADGYTLYFKIVEGGAMVANQPYVIYLPSTKNSFSWSNVIINSVTPLAKAEGENERFQDWTMQANYTPGFSMVGNYGIADGLFRKGIAGSTINAYTAYFIPPGGSNASVRMAVLEEDGGVTYIDDIRGDGEEVSDSEEIYRLDGTRHATLTKGINIVKMANGEVRKVLK